MAVRRDYVALDWVSGEIDSILQQACQALEAYVADPQDITRLRFCLSYVHQVQGTLRMIEFHGAALFAGEIECAVQVLLDGVLETGSEALEAVMAALLQLLAYLDRVRSARTDCPAALLPMINELRSLRGEGPLSEAALFSPPLEAARPSARSAPALDAEEFAQLIRKLRQMFQVAFAGIIRNKRLDQNLEHLARVCQRLLEISQGKAREPLWKIAMAVIEGLANQSIQPNAAVKTLLKEIDSELKGLLTTGAGYFERPVSPELLRNFLYYVAQSEADSPLIEEIREAYGLREALGRAPGEVGVDPRAMESVVLALLDELSQIKDHLDVHARRGAGDESNIQVVLPLIKRVGDTMAVLGIGEPLLAVRRQEAALRALLQRSESEGEDAELSAEELLQMASVLIGVEESLRQASVSGSAGAEVPFLDDARCTVVREVRRGIEQTKEAIIQFVASEWDHTHLEPVSGVLEELRSNLELAGFAAPALILGTCQRYVDQTLLGSQEPPLWQSLDTLADALSGIDYYLERLLEDREDRSEDLLEKVAERIERLEVGMAAVDTEGRSKTADSQESTDREPAWDLAASAFGEQPRAGSVIPSDDPLAATAPRTTASRRVPVEEVTEAIADPDIAEIFVEEAGEVLEIIEAFLPRWQSDPADSEALAELRRAWHTLKGSGRMVGAEVLGELAWSVESLLNKIVEGSLEASPGRRQLVADISAMVPPLVSAYEREQPVNRGYVEEIQALAVAMAGLEGPGEADYPPLQAAWIDPEAARAENRALTSTGPPDEVFPVDAPVAEECSVDRPQAELPPTERPPSEMPPTEMPLTEVPLTEEPSAGAAQGDERSGAGRDRELDEIFSAEAESHLATVLAFIEAAETSPAPLPVSDGLQRALHTLKGAANMAGATLIAATVTPLEGLIKQLQVLGAPAEEPILGVLRDTTRLTFVGLQYLREGIHAEAFDDSAALQSRIRGLVAQYARRENQGSGESQPYLARVGEFMLDAADRLAELRSVLGEWELQRDSDGGLSAAVAADAAAIAEGAGELGIQELARLAESWARAADALPEARLDAAAIGIFERARAGLEDMLDSVAADQAIAPAEPALLEALVGLTRVGERESSAEAGADVAGPAVATDPTLAEANEDLAVMEQIDAEIFDIFLEEARDLLEQLDETIHDWQLDRDNRQHMALLQRLLHTLKGSARLTGLRRLGDLSHDFETYLIDVDAAGGSYDGAFFAQLQRYQEAVGAQVDAFLKRDGGVAEQVPATAVSDPASAEAEPVDSDFLALPRAPEFQASAEPEASSTRNSQETVKLPAQLIDELVNLAGETSINRGRVEEQINELIFSLAEMDSTIDRMQEQLRRLDIETEAQLIFRQEQVESQGLDEFDPLEMDRYSALQQLSRSLMESSSDIQEVKRGIFNRARDIETLLLQQARVNTDLQEGLMRSRMVPFSRMVPRLRRIVRQVSVELGKQVNLAFHNIEGEMDRTILERMVPPFEHMLRNAVDHGMEDESQRERAGKAPVGTIEIGFGREAGDVVITLSDDGRGIDLATVQTKAIERGLLKPGVDLPHQEILRFIMQPGFSTAQSVTQISGRGVGMDVVASEIKQLGGSVDIASTFGQGTRFTIRLPFTVSVNRALMVRCCNENYALPLNTIEGIVRVSPFELESYYQPGAPLFEYAGQAYALRYMGGMIGQRAIPELHSEVMPLPVILVRSGEYSVAVQVDSLLSSREIVVKTLGPQFAAVPGLSGATVLGDGGVVLILDLHTMVRTDFSTYTEQLEEAAGVVAGDANAEMRNRLVMVVDDSVTVRKVTSRFLERNGMDVLLAKDGVDAMQLLQDHTPDVMLLDIEMPRMDGFEVASRIKHSARLKNLPIIMITSRTGDKHRERADAIGVDRYLGKPYQEIELLRNIQELTG